MNSRKTLAIFLAISLIFGSYRSFAQTAEELFPKAIQLEEVKGELEKAIEVYQEILDKFSDNRSIAAKAQFHIGLCYEKLGLKQAQKAYEEVIINYPDQSGEVAQARERLSRLKTLISEVTAKAEQSFKLAADLYKEFKYESAVEEYEKVIKLSPESRLTQESRLWIGQCYYKDGEYDLALVSFNSLIREFPQSTIVPVAELMINQTRQSIENDSKKKHIITLDDKTILDPKTGIKYTHINSIVGKNDIIKSLSNRSADVSPNRKYLLFDNKLIPFGTGASFEAFDFSPKGYIFSKLSPNGSKIAYIDEKSISVISVSHETGRPSGPGKVLMNGEYNLGDNLSWSANSEKLALSLSGNLWILSTRDGSFKQITNSTIKDSNPVFSSNGQNLIYRRIQSGPFSPINIRSLEGQKSLTIIDSCLSYGRVGPKLSQDNKWLIYPQTWHNNYLFRLADKQKRELTSPPEVGDLISWTPKDNKLFYYKPSFDARGANKVLSAFGGPSVELGKQITDPSWLHHWAPDSKSFLTLGDNTEGSNRVFWIVPLDGEAPRELDTKDIEYLQYLSPDASKLLYYKTEGAIRDLLVAPVSLKTNGLSGPSTIIFKNVGNIQRFPQWSSDGSKIVFSTDGDIWICHADGAKPQQLTRTPERENYPELSPDGNLIKYYLNGPALKLQIIQSSDGRVIRVIDGIKFMESAWSPDGKEVAVAFENGLLSGISVATGKSRNIGNWKDSLISRIEDLSWSPDGKTIAFIGDDNANDYENHIYLLNAKAGKITRLDYDDDGYKNLLRWSPDSKWLSFYSDDESKKNRLEGTLWEADLTDFMNKMKPGAETGYTTNTDIDALAAKFPEVKPDGSFTDARDGHVYKYKKIGEQTWMAENLAYLPSVSGPVDDSDDDPFYYVYGYDDTSVTSAKTTDNYAKYGVLYNWAAATADTHGNDQDICPKGWHLPSDEEWTTLTDYLTNNGFGYGSTDSDIGKSMASKSGWESSARSGAVGYNQWSNNSSGFRALPGGHRSLNGRFGSIGICGVFWSSSLNGSSYGWDRLLWYSRPGLIRGMMHNVPGGRDYVGHKGGFSVRCIKDS